MAHDEIEFDTPGIDDQREDLTTVAFPITHEPLLHLSVTESRTSIKSRDETMSVFEEEFTSRFL